jgi:hypothetical protein
MVIKNSNKLVLFYTKEVIFCCFTIFLLSFFDFWFQFSQLNITPPDGRLPQGGVGEVTTVRAHHTAHTPRRG